MTTAPQAKLPWHRPVIRDITAEYYGAPNPIAKLPWHRPVIRDVTHEYPEYGRPNAEQEAARHREIEKRWQRQRNRRGEDKPAKPEDVRLAHLRWRELQRLMRARYGVVMPDTGAARRDLEILLGYAILTDHKPQHQVDLLAPWMDQDEADHMSAHQRPVLHKADDLAQKLDLQYCDRQALAITTIGAIDCDKAGRERLRCQRRNEAKLQKRAAAAKQEKPMQTVVAFSRRQQAVLVKVDDGTDTVPELVKQLARHSAFRGVAAASLPKIVHRTVDELVAAGEIADRYEPGQKGPVRHVSRHQRPSRV
jgi:hypothetical protein